jgi:hypothetical protein
MLWVLLQETIGVIVLDFAEAFAVDGVLEVAERGYVI